MKFDKLLESLAKIDEIVVNRPDAPGQTWSKSQQELEYLLTSDCQSTHKDLCRLEKELHDLNMTFQAYVEQGMKANGKVPNKKAFEQMEKGYKAIRDAIQKKYRYSIENGTKDIEDTCHWLVAHEKDYPNLEVP